MSGKCYLLARGDGLVALSGNLKFLDRGYGRAIFRTFEKSLPEVVGSKLIYLASDHDPLRVWMVAEPRWKWSKEQFQAVDAISRRIEDQKVSIVDGEEVKEWIEIKPVG
jgi:hypothetical protein